MNRRRSHKFRWPILSGGNNHHNHNHNDDDDDFYETRERMSSAVPLDLEASSSDEDDDDGFEDSRMSFASTVSPISEKFKTSPLAAAAAAAAGGSAGSEYDLWMAAPGSIKERRKRLLLGMGLDENKELLRVTSQALDRAISRKFESGNVDFSETENSRSSATASSSSPPPPPSSSSPSRSTNVESENHQRNQIQYQNLNQHKSRKPSIIPFVLGRSRSEGDIDSFSMPKCRKEEFIGKISKQRLTRTASEIVLPCGGRKHTPNDIETTATTVSVGPGRSAGHRPKLSTLKSSCELGAFFLIKNLDTGTDFIVNEFNQDGLWNRVSDLQTGKKLTLEEFEKSVGHSRVVKELMSREKVGRSSSERIISTQQEHQQQQQQQHNNRNQHSYFSKSLRKSKKTGVALLKNIRGVASGFIGERERDETTSTTSTTLTTSTTSKSEDWVKVRMSGKSYKELSALHLCQEIQAHEGCVWVIRFSLDGHFMASAGEDRVIHVWEVQEYEDGSLTPIHPSFLGREDVGSETKKKKWKYYGRSSNGSNNGGIPEYVHVPDSVFSFYEKPSCSFQGHSDDVLDLSWSKSQLLLSSSMDKTVRLWDLESRACLKVFTHNDYVTCIHFNPVDDHYFISGSLDAKVRIWNIPHRYVVDWIDVHEMVTAISYTPDGEAAYVGTHKGCCRTYSTKDCKLSHIGSTELRRKKKSHLRKVTGFQFAPGNPSEVLVTSGDCRTRIVEDSKVVQKFLGFRNANSQISASFSPDGRYVISASEDSQVYVWKNEGHGKGRNLVVTRAHEQFQSKDVSIAIPWPRIIKGDPPLGLEAQNSKRISKHFIHYATSPNSSPIHNSPKKRTLPPLPKKNNSTMSPSRDENHSAEQLSHSGSKRIWSPFFKKSESSNNHHHHHHAIEEDPASISRSSSGIGDSFSSVGSSSSRFGDSNVAASPSFSTLFDNGHANSNGSAWGLVIVTAGFGGEIRCYQNFGLPRKM